MNSRTAMYMQEAKSLKQGDYVFFHTSARSNRYVTAFYIVELAIPTKVAKNDQNIMSKYHNPHLQFKKPAKNDTILFGDPVRSRKFSRPLLFDERLARRLSLEIRFKPGIADNVVISSATRQWRELSRKDVRVLLNESQKHTPERKSLYRTEEIQQLLETDLESYVCGHSDRLEPGLKLVRRQLELTPEDRIDLLFERRGGGYLVVELKLGEIGRDALQQLSRYMHIVRNSKKFRGGVCGALVGSGVLPAFRDVICERKDVKLFSYGWSMELSELSKE